MFTTTATQNQTQPEGCFELKGVLFQKIGVLRKGHSIHLKVSTYLFQIHEISPVRPHDTSSSSADEALLSTSLLLKGHRVWRI